MANMAIENFNSALLRKVKEKKKELGKSAKIYRFNFENARPEEFDPQELELTPPDDCLEYYWIEYEEDSIRKKFSFFYKDVDVRTHNVHVIPGLFEEYRYENEHPKTPYVEVEGGKAIIRNVKSGYPSFAERDVDGGWWVPTSECIPLKADKNTVNEEKMKNFEAIDGFRDVFNDFFEYEEAASKIFVEAFREEKVNMRHYHKKVSERYIPLFWYNIYFTEKLCFMDHFNLLYFENYGFFIQYNCINFTKKDIITNCPIIKTSKDYENHKGLTLTNKLKFPKVKEKFKSFLNGN